MKFEFFFVTADMGHTVQCYFLHLTAFYYDTFITLIYTCKLHDIYFMVSWLLDVFKINILKIHTENTPKEELAYHPKTLQDRSLSKHYT